MFRHLFSLFLAFIVSHSISSAQVLDSARVKTQSLDTLIFVTQQDVNDYIALRKITDTSGNLTSYINIIKSTKEGSVRNPNYYYEGILRFSETNEKYRLATTKPITSTDIADYLVLRNITGDTTGKTENYIKIIKAAKTRLAMTEHFGALYKTITYEIALKEAEENIRLRSLVDKVLVVKHQRKMYLLKNGKAVKTFTVALGKNPVGQKEYEGDGKTPEGIYTLDWQKWNSSTFHSFHISYPNEIDLARAKTKKLTAGSYIMVHGTSKGVKKRKDWTNGCIALNNTDMAEFKRIVFQDTQIEIKK